MQYVMSQMQAAPENSSSLDISRDNFCEYDVRVHGNPILAGDSFN